MADDEIAYSVVSMGKSASVAWRNGALVASSQVNVALSDGLLAGLAVVEDVPCVATEGGVALFRAKDHVARLERGARLCGFVLPKAAHHVVKALVKTVKANGSQPCMVRMIALPLAERNACEALGKGATASVQAARAIDEDAAHAPREAACALPEADLVMLCASFKTPGRRQAAEISSWRRPSANALPPQVGLGARSAVGHFAQMDASRHGAHVAVLLNDAGCVADTTAGALFVVRDGVLSTPPASEGCAESVARDTIVNLAFDLELPQTEERLVRADLYAAEELFAVGECGIVTFASIDGRALPAKAPVTDLLQKRLAKLLSGTQTAYAAWFTPVA